MNLDRISALYQTQAVDFSAGRQRKPPSAGDTVVLVLEEIADDELRATVNGVSMRLGGADESLQSLRPGDALLMRVIETNPLLKLEPYGPAWRQAVPATSVATNGTTGSRSNDLGSQNAMRLDQAALSRIAWRMADGESLAQVWQSQAQSRWGEKPDLELSGSQALAPVAVSSCDLATGADSEYEWRPPGRERDSLAVYFWDGRPMTLGLAVAGDERSKKLGRRRSLVLWLEIDADELGRIVVQVQSAGDAIVLAIAVEQPNAVQVVRDSVPAVAAALARAKIRVARCRLLKGATALWCLTAPPSSRSSQVSPEADAFAMRVFRALAEAAIVLVDRANVVSPTNR
jgi:hypothetical protein